MLEIIINKRSKTREEMLNEKVTSDVVQHSRCKTINNIVRAVNLTLNIGNYNLGQQLYNIIMGINGHCNFPI